MQLKYTDKDLFTFPRTYCLCHCISADFALGAGIARRFDEIYKMRFKLFNRYGEIPETARTGQALRVDNVFNLVAKERYFHKPTYECLEQCFTDMKKQMQKLNVTKLAMPKIGCGLDKLDWNRVEHIIKNVFADTEIEIAVSTYTPPRKEKQWTNTNTPRTEKSMMQNG